MWRGRRAIFPLRVGFMGRIELDQVGFGVEANTLLELGSEALRRAARRSFPFRGRMVRAVSILATHVVLIKPAGRVRVDQVDIDLPRHVVIRVGLSVNEGEIEGAGIVFGPTDAG